MIAMLPGLTALSKLPQMPWPTLPFAAAFGNPRSPVSSWLDMMPMMSAPMGAWPAAFALIAAGMPRGTAWPMATAGNAMAEAARDTAMTVEKIFSSYRSEGGHALAQIEFAPRRETRPPQRTAAAVPPAMQPWLKLWGLA